MTAARQSLGDPGDPPAAIPFDQHPNQRAVSLELDLAGVLGIGCQHPLKEISKRATIFRRHELPELLEVRHVAIQTQQRSPRQIEFQNPPIAIPEEMPSRGEIEQVIILF